MNNPSIKVGGNGYIDSITLQMTHRESFIGFPNLGPPENEDAPQRAIKELIAHSVPLPSAMEEVQQ